MSIESRVEHLEQRANIGASCAKCGGGTPGAPVTVTVNTESHGACNRKVLELCELCGRVTSFSFAILHEDDRLAA